MDETLHRTVVDGRRPRPARSALLAFLVGVLTLVVPGVARAHAALVSSTPEAGSRLSTAPGVVVLRFSEPLIPELSEAGVTDPAGRRSESTEIGERESWFRLWIDPDGLVRRMEMRAEAHFMDHRFTDFDAPITIEAPEDVEGSS